MNSEMIDRLRQAKEYQKKAIYALFPESMSGHLEVIENEMSAMFMELMVEMMKKGASKGMDFTFNASFDKEDNTKSENCDKQTSTKKKTCKKVTID